MRGHENTYALTEAKDWINIVNPSLEANKAFKQKFHE